MQNWISNHSRFMSKTSMPCINKYFCSIHAWIFLTKKMHFDNSYTVSHICGTINILEKPFVIWIPYFGATSMNTSILCWIRCTILIVGSPIYTATFYRSKYLFFISLMNSTTFSSTKCTLVRILYTSNRCTNFIRWNFGLFLIFFYSIQQSIA